MTGTESNLMAASSFMGLSAPQPRESSDFNTVSMLNNANPIPQISGDGSHLRRTTCNLCRERKVRCDRVKPACGRCKRMNQTCTYSSSSGDTALINSVLQSLHSRLGTYT